MFFFDNRLVDLYTAGKAEKVFIIRETTVGCITCSLVCA